MLKTISKLAAVALLLVTLQACDDPDDLDLPDTADMEATDERGVSDGELRPDEDGTVTIRPEGNQMAYADTEFTVEPGQEVRLVFDNVATAPAMSHNVLILDGTDQQMVDRVGQAALEAGADNDYIPEDDAIIAYTPMASPEETVEVTFTAPEEEGEYRFICTFPGHYQLMQGTMHVRS